MLEDLNLLRFFTTVWITTIVKISIGNTNAKLKEQLSTAIARATYTAQASYSKYDVL